MRNQVADATDIPVPVEREIYAARHNGHLGITTSSVPDNINLTAFIIFFKKFGCDTVLTGT